MQKSNEENKHKTRRPDPSPIHEKNATPAEGPKELDEVFDSARPHAVMESRTSLDGTEENVRRSEALSRHAEVRVQTGNKFIDQWRGQYLCEAFPWVLPFACGGPEYPRHGDGEHKRWRRVEKNAPIVTSAEYPKGMPRRVKGQFKNDWTFTPVVRNLHQCHKVLETPLLTYVKPHDSPAEGNRQAAELCEATEGLYWLLQHGKTTTGQSIAFDTTKLWAAAGLTPAQRQLLKDMRFVSQKLPGTQEVHRLEGHSLFGARMT